MSEEPPFERRSENVAYAAGRRDADVDAHLRSHENRLNAINGSIERHAKAVSALGQKVETLAASVESVHVKVDKVLAQQVMNAAVEAERVKQVTQANEKQISTRDFWVGVATVIVMLAIGIATVVATSAH